MTREFDILISAVNSLEPELRCKANVIIAGKDFDGTVHRVQPSDKAAFKIVLRHIEDDELVYLYEHTDYVALPYRKTSQSGILEMAFYFRKPILASDVPYFRRMLTEFPSFRHLVRQGCPGICRNARFGYRAAFLCGLFYRQGLFSVYQPK